MDYNNKRFRTVTNTNNGETSTDTIFDYKQKGNVLTSEYQGGKIVVGHILGIVKLNGEIDMHYHQINNDG